MRKNSKVSRLIGDVVAVPLGDGTFSYGRVLREPLMAFYGARTSNLKEPIEVVQLPVLFIVFVMNSAVTDGVWPVLGNIPLEKELLVEPLFFKKDAVSKKISIYRDSTGEEFPASREECEDLECAAVWEPTHVVDRLIDAFEERPNKWVESMRP